MTRYLFIVTVGIISLLTACSGGRPAKSSVEITDSPVIVSSGRVERFVMPCEYAKERIIDVWLPDSYSRKNKYSVLYAQDGNNLFDASKMFNNQEWRLDEVTDSLMKENKISKTIIVGIHCTRYRFSEYLPQKATDYLSEEGRIALREEVGNCKSDSYLKFVVEELKPFIEDNYSVKKGPGHTGIIGSSMGGLISLYAICEYPEEFGSAACISTHWPGLIPSPRDTTYSLREGYFPEAMYRYMENSLPDPASHKIYFDHGDMTLDASYGPYQKKADKVMENAGYTPDNWISRVFPGKAHVESSWASRVHIPLLFILGK